LGLYRVQDKTKEEFVKNAVRVKMQCRHFSIACHATTDVNVASNDYFFDLNIVFRVRFSLKGIQTI